MDTVGLIVVLIFYIIIVAVGIIAARYERRKLKSSGVEELDGKETGTEQSMVGGRNISLCVGVFTISATAVGGGFLSGTAEGVAVSGLVWTVYPLTFLLSTMLAAAFYVRPMRERQYLTILDPLQEKFGDVMTGLLLCGLLFAELLWGATVLMSLATGLAIIVDIDVTLSTLVSASVAFIYTVYGQMVSVSYTDVLQFILVIAGMVLCIPFVYTSEHTQNAGDNSDTWVGSIPTNMILTWIDFFLSQLFGALPWNTLVMRFLSARTVRQAQIMSVLGGAVALLMAAPSIMIGVAAVSANWTDTDYQKDPLDTCFDLDSSNCEASSILPLSIRYFTPRAVAITTMAAIVAAVMSSMDSIILSSSSMFTHNIYKLAVRKKAEEKELKIVQSLAMLAVTVVCSVVALTADTIFGLYVLTADIVYVVVFPQLTCAIFLEFSHPLGSFVGFVIGLILRLGGGEPSMNLEPFIYYPLYSDADGQTFPFRTLAMLSNMAAVIIISWLCKYFGFLPQNSKEHAQIPPKAKQEEDNSEITRF